MNGTMREDASCHHPVDTVADGYNLCIQVHSQSLPTRHDAKSMATLLSKIRRILLGSGLQGALQQLMMKETAACDKLKKELDDKGSVEDLHSKIKSLQMVKHRLEAQKHANYITAENAKTEAAQIVKTNEANKVKVSSLQVMLSVHHLAITLSVLNLAQRAGFISDCLTRICTVLHR